MARNLSLIALLLFSNSLPAGETSLLRLHGSNTVGSKLAPDLVTDWLTHKGYQVSEKKTSAPHEMQITARNPANDTLVVEIHTNGTPSAFVDLSKGQADIGMASRRIKSEEEIRLSRLGPMAQAQCEYVVALDGIAIIVHPNSPVQKLSKRDVQRIYTGQVTDWSDLGYPAGRIEAFARNEDSGTQDTFNSLVLGSATLAPRVKRFNSSEDLANEVELKPNAIGFVGLTYSHTTKQIAISDDGTKAMWPLQFNVATEDYPLSRRLYFYLPKNNRNPLAQELAEYIVSNAGQQIAKHLGFISQEVIAAKQTAPTEAPSEYKSLVQNAERLSLNIRFNPGSAKLDTKAVRDIGRVVDYMARPENKARKLMVLGFSDSKEAASYLSLSYSVNRADAVADYLLQAGVEAERVRGFGDTLPVADNVSDHGRNYNRRVELWIH